MPKRRQTLQIALPAYERDRSRWRERILAQALKAATAAAVAYTDSDSLEVVVLLYLREGKRLTIHDTQPSLTTPRVLRASRARRAATSAGIS